MAAVPACASEWHPDSYPVDLVVLGDTTEGQRATVLAAVDEMEAATGEHLFKVKFKPDGLTDCGRVHIRFGEPGGGDLGYCEHTGWKRCHAEIVALPLTGIATMVHELGHAIGLAHSEDPASVMYSGWGPNQYLTDEDVELLRGAVEATR